MPKLEGKVAVITGASSGMALATAKLFVAEGAHVYITARRAERLAQAAHELSALGGARAVTPIQADSGATADLDRLFDTVKANHGRIDVLYVAAGMGKIAEPLTAVTEVSFDRVFGLNVRGTVFTVQRAVPLMLNGGSIILNGSASAVKGIPGSGVYAASKAALRALVRTWTPELAGLGIRVNLIAPGPILDTGSFRGAPDETKTELTRMIPAGRGGQSAEIATAVLFLASSDSSFVYGAELAVDGGFAQI
jgi:NAD(P)-dependent dehydrogenase (short-subunit alcohol dehydrogenase family)